MSDRGSPAVEARLRAALRELIDATDGVKTSNGVTARQAAQAVYLDTLPEETKEAMLAAARLIWDAAPTKSFVSGTVRCETYREALEGFGTSLLDRVIELGPEAAAREFAEVMDRALRHA